MNDYESELRELAGPGNEKRLNDPVWREMMMKMIRCREHSKEKNQKKYRVPLQYGYEYTKDGYKYMNS